MSYVSAITDSRAFEGLKKTFLFGNKKRNRALRKMSTYIDNNVQLTDALGQMIKNATKNGRHPKAYAAQVYSRWLKTVSNGGHLHDALKGYVPEAERQMIASANAYGRLGQGIRDALQMQESMKQIRSALRSAMMYPVILLGGITGYFYFMATSVFPGFHDALPADKWPSSAQNLEATANFVTNHLVLLYGGVALIVAIVTWSLSRWVGMSRLRAERFPPYSLYKVVYGTVFLLSFAGYIKAGMNAPEVLKQMLKNANPWYAERLRAIKKRIDGGDDLGDALAKTIYDFPENEVIEDLRTYAKFKNFSQALSEIGEVIMQESVARIQGQSVLVRNIALGCIGALLLWFTNSLFDFQHVVALQASSPT